MHLNCSRRKARERVQLTEIIMCKRAKKVKFSVRK